MEFDMVGPTVRVVGLAGCAFAVVHDKPSKHEHDRKLVGVQEDWAQPFADARRRPNC